MKKILLLTVSMIITGSLFAQLTGTKTIPGDYATIAAAITDLNTLGVGAGGVTFNVAAGHAETILAPLSVTATGTLADPIIFQKSGAGVNPVITSFVGTATPSSAIQDGIWNLVGSDYVTIDGIDLLDPNATNPATMEYGFGLYKASVSDGCQNNTIKNCVVTLSRVNNASATAPAVEGSRAINVMNALVATQSSVAVPTTAGGTNSFNRFYSNTLQNCNYGIALIGYAGATPFTLCDFGNDIGGSSIATGNSILNYGGAASATNPAAGVRTLAQYDLNVSYNTVTNNNGSGVNHVSTLRGIYLNTAVSANATISYNDLSITSGATTSQVSVIENVSGGTAAGNAININNNTIDNCSWTTSTTGTFYGIYNTSTCATLNINNNTFATISKAGTGILHVIETGSPVTVYVTNNSIGTISRTGIGTINGIRTTSPTNLTVTGNTIDGVNQNAASSTGSSYGFYGLSSSVNVTVSNNIFRNFTSTGTGGLYGIREYGVTGIKNIQNNQIYNFSCVGGSFYGIYTSTGTVDISNNEIYALNATGGTAGAAYGIYISGGTANSIYKNKVYDLSIASAGPTVYGIYLGGGTTNYIYNNFISDLRTPIASSGIPLAGIYVSGGTTSNVFYNTVYLNATSSGTTFGSAALYASTTPTVDSRNNVLVNTSIPNGTGVTAAYRRSGTGLTTYSNNSNANCYYAGDPEDATHAVYYNGTTAYNIADFKTLVGPSRDAVSFRELPPFVNVTTAPYDLHMQTTVPTNCMSGGIQITTPIAITDDYDGNARAANPCVGADEFAGMTAGVVNPGNFVANVISSQQINLTFNLNPSNNNVVVVWNATGTFTTPSGAPPANVGDPFAGGNFLYNGTSSPVNHTGLTPATPYYYKAFSYDGSSYSSGVTANATPSVAPPTAFTATPISSSQINLAYTLNAQSNSVLIATNSSNTFGTPVNGTAYIAGNPLPDNGTVLYIGPLAAFNHAGLTENTPYYYKIWSFDAFDYYSATGATANATTLCEPVASFPFNEGFESGYTDASTVGGCWTQEKTGSYYWTANSSQTTYNRSPRTGTWDATLHYSGDSWLFMKFSLTAGTTYDVSCWARQDGSNTTYASMEIKYGTTGTAAGMTGSIAASTGLNATYAQISGSFSPATSGDYYIGFHGVINSNPWYITLDDIQVSLAASCPVPTLLTATNIATNSADLGWTSTETAWEYQIGLEGFTPAETGTATTVNPTPVSGLIADQGYDFYVRANCGGGDYSDWSLAKNFRTLCSSTTIPFTENFDSYTPPAVGCGTVIDVNADNIKWATSAGSTYNGANKLAIGYSAVGVVMDDWYMTQGLTLTGGQSYDVKFYYRALGTTFPERLEVKWGNSPTAAGMTSSAIFSNVDFTFTTYTLGQGTFTPATTGTYYVGWHCFSLDDEYGIYLDAITVTETPYAWTGGNGTDWADPLNWNPNAVPTSSIDVLIPSVTNLPIVNEGPGTPAVCKSLTINTGASLTIAAGKALSVSGTTNLLTPECLIIKSGGSFIDNGTISGSGNAKVERGLDVDDWHYISSPISNGLTGIFANDYLRTSDPTKAGGWGDYITALDQSLQVMRGYSVWRKPAGTETKYFTGNLNTGNKSITFNCTASDPYAGWNLAGNPYPSSIDLSSAGITWGNLEASVWFWNPVGNNYETYSVSSGGTHSKYVPPLQAFYTHIPVTSPGNTDLQFTNVARVHSTQSFYKETPADQLIIIASSAQNTFYDKTGVQFVTDATTGYDPGFDAKKLAGKVEAPQLYSILTDINVTYNALPWAGTNTTIPLGFKCGLDGNYTFNAEGIASFRSGTQIFLEDKKLNVTQELNLNPAYAFSYLTSDEESRFVLHFSNPFFGNEEPGANSVTIYSFEDDIYIRNMESNPLEGDVFVFDLLGRQVLHTELHGDLITKITVPSKKGYYVVRVITQQGSYNQKVYLY